MINFNDCKFEASMAGLFYTDKNWTHPTTSIDTYEIIYVMEGTVYIKEGEVEYTLTRHNMLLLEPGKIHGGFKPSTGVTSFYWVHFYASDITKLPPLPKVTTSFDESYTFKEYLHLNEITNYTSECTDIFLLNLLAKISHHDRFNANSSSSKLANEVYEYIKLNASPKLPMKQVASHFGVTHEHLTRLFIRHFGIGIKKLNNDFLITSINNMLANTNYSVKEIAGMLGFDDANNFLKFYKYQTGITPTKYRNVYSFIHMNDK